MAGNSGPWWERWRLLDPTFQAINRIEAKFKRDYPKADSERFAAGREWDDEGKPVGKMFFRGGGDGKKLVSVYDTTPEEWTPNMKRALGWTKPRGQGFPFQLSASLSSSRAALPAEPWTSKPQSLKRIFNEPMDIYVTSEGSFKASFRKIFDQRKLKFMTRAELNNWLKVPNTGYWQKELNFAVFCATQGCGVSREIFDSGLELPKQIRAFYKFHVYFTVRRILYQLGGAKKAAALPGDAGFEREKIRIDQAEYMRLCKEFAIDPKSDFGYKGGLNHGKGSVIQYVKNRGPERTRLRYPESGQRFRDEGGDAKKGTLIYYMEQNSDAEDQADWFAPNKADGLTKAGLARINESIEAYVYSILGAQVNMRSSILGEGGRATQAQQEFVRLVEDSIRQNNEAQRVQKYQLAVDEARARLNLAVASNAWLMPENMIFDMTSTTGYNNSLKEAGEGFSLGVNNEANVATKKAGLTLMQGAGPTKVFQPRRPAQEADQPSAEVPTALRAAETTGKFGPPSAHEDNKTALFVGSVAVAALIAWLTR